MSIGSTGVRTFTTVINSEVLTPQTLPATGNPSGENTTQTAPKRSIYIHSVDIVNTSGSTCAVGWGYRFPATHIQIGNWDGTTLTDKTTAVQAGSAVLGTRVLVGVPEPFNSVGLTISNFGTAATCTSKYWNGSSLASLTELTALAPTSNTFCYNVAIPPIAWVPVASGDALATAGMKVGHYVLELTLSSTVTVSTASVVRLVDYVKTVTDGNGLSRTFIEKKVIPAGCPIVPYISTAAATNTVQIDFGQ